MNWTTGNFYYDHDTIATTILCRSNGANAPSLIPLQTTDVTGSLVNTM